ncbi:ABC transporter permease [Rhodomicrobium sp.]|uniref:ABC transporter permease n=1 Tax=Rhodomicrobium sp. TaxID=2720632 RepID=UPI0039E528EC
MIWETIKLALQAIRRNLMRSFLTTLGVVIGVAAVITMVTLGQGSTHKITQDIAKLGTNLLVLRPGQAVGPGGVQDVARQLEIADADAIRREIAGTRAVAPAATRAATAIANGKNWSTNVTGAETTYLTAREWPVAEGRAFNDGELRAGRSVCLIGKTIQREVFGGGDVIGQSMRVGKISCEIVGVLAEKGESAFGQDQDDLVVIPLRTFHRRVAGNTDVGYIYIAVDSQHSTAKTLKAVELLMRERRRIGAADQDDFFVRDMKEITATLTGTYMVLTGLLSAVAAISLLVGGIGIMNIMLVSVTERTREIGTRLAIGALAGQVLTQFLIEAVVLSLFGGLIGVGLGLGLSWLLASAIKVPMAIDLSVIALAFGFSAAVGVIFGYFPARKAARLDPIEALRHE